MFPPYKCFVYVSDNLLPAELNYYCAKNASNIENSSEYEADDLRLFVTEKNVSEC
jgi:hypothetical protein